jgi:hypothetical protein
MHMPKRGLYVWENHVTTWHLTHTPLLRLSPPFLLALSVPLPLSVQRLMQQYTEIEKQIARGR